MLQDCSDLEKHSLRMVTQRMRKCPKMLSGAFMVCVFAVVFQGVLCDFGVNEEEVMRFFRGDGDLTLPTAKSEDNGGFQVHVIDLDNLFPSSKSWTAETTPVEISVSTQAAESTTYQQSTQIPDQPDTDLPKNSMVTSNEHVMCVDEIPERYKHNVELKLKSPSTCEETKAKIQSVLEHLCGEDCKLEIYQEDNTDKIIVYGDSIEANPEEMADKFNNDNILDKVEVEEAVSRTSQRSKVVFVSVLIAGLLLAALLIAGYLLKTRQEEPKGLRLAEESYPVDQQSQGNTLLSDAPLPQQEPLDKPVINGESTESAPTNGHSGTQTQVADTPM
ncbi:uncharacterized protein [Misgurnus anguillicaudatus]|uniref:uncharacterized protein n=1 Tax=Misgurnus anguillicaudatus TaxID=75329 RepID=UPI003CCF12CD